MKKITILLISSVLLMGVACGDDDDDKTVNTTTSITSGIGITDNCYNVAPIGLLQARPIAC